MERALQNHRDPAMIEENQEKWNMENFKDRSGSGATNMTCQMYRTSQNGTQARAVTMQQTLVRRDVAIPQAFVDAVAPHAKDKPEDDPYRGKCHILGYAGCVPGLVHLVGGTYTSLSRKALAGEHVPTLNITGQTALNFPQPVRLVCCRARLLLALLVLFFFLPYMHYLVFRDASDSAMLKFETTQLKPHKYLSSFVTTIISCPRT